MQTCGERFDRRRLQKPQVRVGRRRLGSEQIRAFPFQTAVVRMPGAIVIREGRGFGRSAHDCFLRSGMPMAVVVGVAIRTAIAGVGRSAQAVCPSGRHRPMRMMPLAPHDPMEQNGDQREMGDDSVEHEPGLGKPFPYSIIGPVVRIREFFRLGYQCIYPGV